MKQEFDDEISLSDIVLKLWRRRGLVCALPPKQRWENRLKSDATHLDGYLEAEAGHLKITPALRAITADARGHCSPAQVGEVLSYFLALGAVHAPD